MERINKEIRRMLSKVIVKKKKKKMEEMTS